MAEIQKIPGKKPRPIEGNIPAAQALRNVVDRVYGAAWDAKKKRRISWMVII